jgi:hypothetical protein
MGTGALPELDQPLTPEQEAELDAFEKEIGAESTPVDAPSLEATPSTPASPPAAPDAAPSDQPPPASPDSPAATPEAPAPDAAPVLPIAAVLKADGTELPIKAERLADGALKIPADQVGNLQRHLADRSQWAVKEKGLRSQADKAARQLQQAEQRNKTVIDAIRGALGKGPDEFYEFFQGFERDFPVLLQQLENQRLKGELDDARAELAPVEQERTLAELQPALQEGLTTFLGDVLKDPQYAGLDAKDASERLWDLRGVVLGFADRDYPEHGLQRGQPYVQQDVVHRELQRMARDRQEIAKARAEVEAERARVKATQAAQAAVQPVTAPPAVSARGSANPNPVKPTTYAPGEGDRWAEEYLSDLTVD